jgi:HAE1 family hydrophobic/amphiphilic exporter-1
MVEMPARQDDPAAQGFLIRITIYRPVSILMLALAFAVVGVISYQRIALQLMPDGLSSGGCGIYIPVPDSTPREVMEQVVKPAEDLLRSIPGLTRITSSSGARRANIRIEFSARADVNTIIAEIRDRLDRAKAQWPRDVERYSIWRQNDSDMPVYIAALSLDVDEEKVDVDYLFDEVIKKRLVAIDGVARVNLWGLLDKRVEIELDPDRVEAHGIRLMDLVARLTADNRTVNAGTIREGDHEFLVAVDGKFRQFDEIRRYPADVNFRVSDFAKVGFGYSVRDRMSRVNGHRSRVIVVNKESSANAVEVCDRIAAALREMEDTLRRSVPGLTKVDAHAWMNQGEQIRYSIASVKESGLWGALFAVLVLYLFFRNVGMTLLVTLAIPFSLLITIVWMFFRGQSFNVMSLMGLTLGIGMLVDNSIVVVENIIRHRAAGATPRNAAILGVKEVGLAVSLATLTTIIVFLPGFFISDPMIRGFFLALGEPVSISVLASLLVALVFVPQGAVHLEAWRARRLSRRVPAAPAATASSDPFVPAYSAFNRFCARTAVACNRHRIEAVIILFSCFGFSKLLYDAVPKNDMPPGGPRRLEVDLKLQKNFTLREADQVFAQVEKAILDRRQELEVQSVTSWFSAAEGEVNVFLENGSTIKEEDFLQKLKPLLPQLPGVTYRLGYEDFARDEGNQRLRIFVRGNDLNRLTEIGSLVEEELLRKDIFPELEEVSPWRENRGRGSARGSGAPARAGVRHGHDFHRADDRLGAPRSHAARLRGRRPRVPLLDQLWRAHKGKRGGDQRRPRVPQGRRRRATRKRRTLQHHPRLRRDPPAERQDDRGVLCASEGRVGGRAPARRAALPQVSAPRWLRGDAAAGQPRLPARPQKPQLRRCPRFRPRFFSSWAFCSNRSCFPCPCCSRFPMRFLARSSCSGGWGSVWTSSACWAC